MLGSLRLRLLASFGLVVVLSLFLAGLSGVLLLRDQQAAAAEERIGRLVDPMSQYLQRMQALGWPPERIADELANYARYYNVRIMLVDQDKRIVLDTNVQQPATGELLSSTPVANDPRESYRSLREQVSGEDLFLFTAADRNEMTPAGWPYQVSELSLVLAVPADDVTAAWARLLPRLLLALGGAVLFAVFIGSVLASRITRPIRQMTRASEAMAHGDYSQRIEVEGQDEVATLASSFNQMAEQVGRSSHSMRQLIADVSHELKTPLTSIQGFSQAILDGVVEDEQEIVRHAEVIHEEAERMRSLVEDLLYLSRIESGELPLNRERIELDGLVADAARRFRFQAEATNVTVRTALAGAPVLADARRIEQVLANLLENAIRFAPPHSEVLMRTYTDRGAVAIEVHNGGDPIPEQDLPYVFERFYQVDRARTRGGHSGLGLAIVRELVQAHGGEVSVQSSAGSGTIFTVRLPLYSEASVATPVGEPHPEQRPSGAGAAV